MLSSARIFFESSVVQNIDFKQLRGKIRRGSPQNIVKERVTRRILRNKDLAVPGCGPGFLSLSRRIRGANVHDPIVRFSWRGSRLVVTSNRGWAVENLSAQEN
jgi:hypothetical protein